jgi:uncharacterized protein
MYIAICHDKPGPEAGKKRMEFAAAHLAYVETILDRIAVAGPVRDESCGTVASVLIYKVDSEAEARALLEGDPYFAASIWDGITVGPFLAAAGQWVGGKTW